MRDIVLKHCPNEKPYSNNAEITNKKHGLNRVFIFLFIEADQYLDKKI